MRGGEMTTEPTMPTAVFPALEGKIVLITGASRGIGRAIAEEFAKHKSHLMLVDILESVEQTAAEISSTYHTKVGFLLADVTDPVRVKEVVAETVKPYDRRLDVLVNNAGITRDRLAKGMPDEEWDAVIGTNLTGTHNFCKASIRYLRKAKGNFTALHIEHLQDIMVTGPEILDMLPEVHTEGSYRLVVSLGYFRRSIRIQAPSAHAYEHCTAHRQQ